MIMRRELEKYERELVTEHQISVDTSEISSEQILRNLRAATAALTQIQKDAKVYQKNFLKKKAKFYGECHNIDAEQAVIQIAKHERDREEFRQLGKITRQDRKGGVDFINVPRELMTPNKNKSLTTATGLRNISQFMTPWKSTRLFSAGTTLTSNSRKRRLLAADRVRKTWDNSANPQALTSF